MPGLMIKLNFDKHINAEKCLHKISIAYKVPSISYKEKTIYTKNVFFYSLLPGFIKEERLQKYFNGRYLIAIDGDYYNSVDLKNMLKLQDKSKLETLLYLYMNKGDSFAKYVNGEFVIVIYDSKKNKLIISNDRYARKSFFWSNNSNCFICASEKKGILATIKGSQSLNAVGIIELFLYRHNINGKTFINNIYALKPASFLVIENKSLALNSYFQWDFEFRKSSFNRKERLNEISEMFSTALRQRLINKKRILLWLSGGYDSRAIACFIPPNLRKNIHSETYGDHKSDEVNIAKNIAKKLSYNWQHRLVEGSYLDISKIGTWRSEFAIPSLDHPFVKLHNSMKINTDYIIQGVPGLNEINSGHLRMGKILASLKPDTYNNYFKVYSNSLETFSFLFHRDFLKEYYSKAKNEFINFFVEDNLSSKLNKWDKFNLTQRQPNYSHMADLVENDLFETLHPFTDINLIPLFTQIPLKEKLFLQISKDLLYQKCSALRDIPFGNGRGFLRKKNNIYNSFYYELKSILFPQTHSLIWDKKKALELEYDNIVQFINSLFNEHKEILEIFNLNNIKMFLKNKNSFVNNYSLVDVLITFLIAYDYFLSGKEIITPEIVESNYNS